MNSNSFSQHFHSQSTSFYDSLLSLEKFIDKKHAFDDFAHLVFKAPLFEDLMAVVSVYTSAFGPMSDREVAMVQKRMYQLNRQTVRAMHEIINQKQLIAGINSKETGLHSGVTKTPPASGSYSLNTTPLPMHVTHSPLAPRASASQTFGGFGGTDLPTTILNTPVHTPNGPDRFMNSKQINKAMDCSFNDRSSMTVQDLLRIQQNWAANVINNAGCQRMNDSSTLHTPPNPVSLSMMDNNVAAAAAAFFMSPPSQSSVFPNMMQDRPMIFGGGNIVDDCGKLRNNGRITTTRRRLRSETALLDM